MAQGRPHLTQAPVVDVRRAFEPLDADDLEVLDLFLVDAELVGQSRFARHLDHLGERPRLTIDRRYPMGGGKGRIRITSVSSGVRLEAFPTLRKLRTESNWTSLAAVRKLLHRRARRVGTIEAEQLVAWLAGLKVHIRQASQGPALVGFRVTDARSTREYETSGKVLSLVQNGSVFHNEKEPRRDLEALPGPLLDPVVDDALRQVAEITLALGHLVLQVVREPALRRR